MSHNLFAICITLIAVVLIHGLSAYWVEYQKGENVRALLRAQQIAEDQYRRAVGKPQEKLEGL